MSNTADPRTWAGASPTVAGTEWSEADQLLARAADATFVLDVESGRAVHRWYDPETSRLSLPEDPLGERLIEWVHPDDLPDVMASFADVLSARDSRAVMARIHPNRSYAADSILLIRMQTLDGIDPDSALVQVFVADSERIVARNDDPTTSLSSLAAAAPVGLQLVTFRGRIVFENERFTDLAAGAQHEIGARVASALRSGTVIAADVRAGDRWLRLRVVPTLDDDGGVVMAVASLEDVTQVQVAEAGRRQAEELFEAVFDSSPMATALVGLDGRFVRVNEAFAVVTGYTVDELEQMTFQAITHPADLAADEDLLAEVRAGIRPGYQLEKRYVHRTGHDLWVELNVAPVAGADGAVHHYVAHVQDISSRRSAVEFGSADDLTYWATHDHLTGLPNRRFIDHHVQVALARSRRADDVRPVVMFIDLDDFKPVNDSYGHGVGDEVLRTIGRRLRRACGQNAVVGRYGGDEFVVVAHGMRTVDEVPIIIERIRSAVREPVSVSDDRLLQLGASIGISVARAGDTAAALLARADGAVYRAKRRGKDRAAYHED